MKPLLALDIDGTLTADHDQIPELVLKRLQALQERGWDLLFITGRSFVRSAKLFESFKLPYHLAVLNGSEIFLMPKKERIYSQLLPAKWLPKIEEKAREVKTGVALYSGGPSEDLCYFRKEAFDLKMQRYLEERSKSFNETWVDLGKEPFPLAEIAAIKTFGTKEQLEKLALLLEEVPVDFSILSDRFQRTSFVGLATRKDVTKGTALEHLIGHLGGVSFVAAAGDDLNDLSMLKASEFSISFEGAPNALLEVADLVVPAAESLGILKALDQLEEKKW